MIYFSTPAHITLNKETGKMAGALYELLDNYIAPEMGVTFKWNISQATVPRIIASLEENQIDACPLLVYSSDRAKKILFTEKPFFISQPAILVLMENNLKEVSKIEDILNMKIGYSQKTFITPFMQDKRVDFDMYQSPNFMELNCKKLLNKRVQAVYAPDKAGLLYEVRKLALENQMKCLDLPENKVPFYVVFAKSSKSEGWVKRYNTAFNNLNGQELYIELLAKHLDVNKL